MALVISDAGEQRLLLELMDGNTAREDWYIRLYKNIYIPVASSVVGSFTECDFSNYSQKTLTRTQNNGVTWSNISSAAPTGSWNAQAAVAKMSYASLTWTCTSGSQTIYGYYVVGVSSGLLIFAEFLRDGGVDIYSGNPFVLTPKFELGSGNGW